MSEGRVAFRAPGWLGDAVMATVIPMALRRVYAEKDVTVLCTQGLGDLFRGLPVPCAVREFERGTEVDAYREGAFDRVLLGPDSFGSAWRAFRGGVARRGGFATARRGLLLTDRLACARWRRDRHQVENYRELGDLWGETHPTDEPRIVPRGEWVEAAAGLWPKTGPPRVALQPGASYGPAKRWPVERYAALVNALLDRGLDVALVGGPADHAISEEVLSGVSGTVTNLTGKTTVGTLAAILHSADTLVTNDTGPMHLCAAVGTPVVAIFGSTSPLWTGPRGEGHRIVQERLSCAPCFRRACRIGYGCLLGIAVERVLADVETILNRGSA